MLQALPQVLPHCRYCVHMTPNLFLAPIENAFQSGGAVMTLVPAALQVGPNSRDGKCGDGNWDEAYANNKIVHPGHQR